MTRIKVSRVAQNFAFGVLTFDHAVKERLAPTPIGGVDDNGNYDPLAGHGGGTSIYPGARGSRARRRSVSPAGARGRRPALGSDSAHERWLLLGTGPDAHDRAAHQDRAERLPHHHRVHAVRPVGNVDRAGEALLRGSGQRPCALLQDRLRRRDAPGNFMLASASAASGGQIP